MNGPREFGRRTMSDQQKREVRLNRGCDTVDETIDCIDNAHRISENDTSIFSGIADVASGVVASVFESIPGFD